MKHRTGVNNESKTEAQTLIRKVITKDNLRR